MKNWKYIVYLTTNLVNGKIYVGLHKTEDPDKFDGYIGNGIYVTQPYTYEHAKTAFQCAVKKYGPKNFKRTVLAVFNTESEASDLEEQIVNESFLARDDVYNMILKPSTVTQIYCYSKDGSYIKEFKNCTKACNELNVCCSSLKKSIVLGICVQNQYYFSTIKAASYSEAKTQYIKIRPVYKYDLQTGTFIEGYNTQAEAELKNPKSNITKSIRLKENDGNGFIWALVKVERYNRLKW